MSNRFIKLFDGAFFNPILQNPENFRAWAHLIWLASWRPEKKLHRGQIIKIDRGQLMGARSFLAKKLAISERKVRTLLKLLENDGMIKTTRCATSNVTIITICNYSQYQDTRPASDQQNDQQATSKRPASDHIRVEDTRNLVEEEAATRTRENLPKSTPSHPQLFKKLLDAARPVMREMCTSIHDTSSVQILIDGGADLERDVLPAVREAAARKEPGSVSSWKYFAAAIVEKHRLSTERERKREEFNRAQEERVRKVFGDEGRPANLRLGRSIYGEMPYRKNADGVPELLP